MRFSMNIQQVAERIRLWNVTRPPFTWARDTFQRFEAGFGQYRIRPGPGIIDSTPVPNAGGLGSSPAGAAASMLGGAFPGGMGSFMPALNLPNDESPFTLPNLTAPFTFSFPPPPLLPYPPGWTGGDTPSDQWPEIPGFQPPWFPRGDDEPDTPPNPPDGSGSGEESGSGSESFSWPDTPGVRHTVCLSLTRDHIPDLRVAGSAYHTFAPGMPEKANILAVDFIIDTPLALSASLSYSVSAGVFIGKNPDVSPYFNLIGGSDIGSGNFGANEPEPDPGEVYAGGWDSPGLSTVPYAPRMIFVAFTIGAGSWDGDPSLIAEFEARICITYTVSV